MHSGDITRAAILDAVRREPGLSKSELCRQRNLGWGTVNYHLQQLQEEGALVLHRADGRALVFPSEFGPREMAWLAALRDPVSQELLSSMPEDSKEGFSMQHLAQEVGCSRKVIRRQLDTMHRVGIITQLGPRRSARYRVRSGMGRVLDRLLRRNQS